MADAIKKISTDEETKLAAKNKVLGFLRGSASLSSYKKYMMQRCYQYFEGSVKESQYRSLASVYDLKKETGQGAKTLKMPTIFVELNHIKVKVRALEGELDTMGFKPVVEAINKEAKSRKLDMKVEMLTAMSMRPHVDMAAAMTGIDIGMQEDLPNTEQELEKRFKSGRYKDVSEMAMDACLKYSLQYWNYLLMRFQLFRDVLIGGECHAETSVVNGFPKLERHNNLNVFYSINPDDDDLLSKTNNKGIVYYADVNDIMNQFTLTEEQITKSKDIAIAGVGDAFLGIQYNNINYFLPWENDYKLVLVAKWKWVDTVKKAGVEITYADGRTEFRVTKDAKERLDKTSLGIPDDATFRVTRKTVSTLKKATLIAGDIVVDEGEEQFLIRDTENVNMALCPIVSYRPYYHNGSSKSEVAQLTEIQDLRNYVMTMVTLEITKSGGSALAVDVSKLPKEWGTSPEQKMGKVLHYLKGFGILVYNSAESEIPGQNQIPVQRFDNGIGQTLLTYVSIMQLLESEMDKISGVGQARLGQIQSANQLNGVTEMALNQSNTITKYLYKGFFEFESRLLTYHCQQIKMAWIYNPERFTPIIGDLYFDFLKQDVDITMDTHAATVRPEDINIQTLRNYIQLAVQSNALPLDEALKLEITAQEDVRTAVYDYIEEIKERREKQEQAQKESEQSQQQTMLQQGQQKVQGDQSLLAQQGQQNYRQQQLKSNTDLTKTKIKEQAKMIDNEHDRAHEFLMKE